MKLSFLTVSLLTILLSSHAQKRADSLFADFDLITLKGLRNIPANNPDSLVQVVKNTRSSSGKLQALEVVSYRYENPKSRKATVQYTPLGIIIGFQTLKTPGWEKVLFIGQKFYYHDSILIRNDTIFFKSLYDESVTLEVIPPVKNDTLRIRSVYKNYRGPDLDPRYNAWINLANYNDWFKTNSSDRVRTYTLVKSGDHYELVRVNTDEKNISEYDYKTKQEFYRKLGLSPFWIAMKSNLSWP
jgi:hypothetical protein